MDISVPVNFLFNVRFDIDETLSEEAIQYVKDKIAELVYDRLTGDLDDLVENITEETGWLIEGLSASAE